MPAVILHLLKGENIMTDLCTFHPAIQRAVRRHEQFFAGTRDYLLMVHLPANYAELEASPTVDTLNWEQDFDEYVRINVDNGKLLAQRRLECDIDDDLLPCYHPYFGISIHHSFFGGAVTFGGGTSYAAPVISMAAEWQQLRPDVNNIWLQRLTRGMAYCREHGDGVLLACFRGGNGPLDMATGVLGDALFTEFYEDPEHMHQLMEVCWQATLLTFDLQRRYCTELAGGHVIPAGVWLPGNAIGHLSVDASCLISPGLFDEFEKPYLEQITARTGGAFIHLHMLGRHSFANICRVPGVLVASPADDPNQPALLDALDEVLASVGDIPLTVGLRRERLAQDLPKFRHRRAIFSISAADRDNALTIMEEINRYCPLER